MAARTTQTSFELDVEGTPEARTTQTSIEYVAAGSPKARNTQMSMEWFVPVELKKFFHAQVIG